MKRAEESILSRDYKKHIQVGGGPHSLSSFSLQKGPGLGNRKPPACLSTCGDCGQPEHHPALFLTEAWVRLQGLEQGQRKNRLRLEAELQRFPHC